MSAILKAESEAAPFSRGFDGWYPLIEGFGVRVLMRGEAVRTGDFHLTSLRGGEALYLGDYADGNKIGDEAFRGVGELFRYTAWAGDAPVALVWDCLQKQIAAQQEAAWSELCAAVDLFRAALTTGKPDLIAMRDMRCLEIMNKNDFGCRVGFDSLTGHVWREYGYDSSDDSLE